jgi:hypothetical protein
MRDPQSDIGQRHRAPPLPARRSVQRRPGDCDPAPAGGLPDNPDDDVDGAAHRLSCAQPAAIFVIALHGRARSAASGTTRWRWTPS